MIDPQFPLVELHRHLDGSVRLQTILELAQQHNLPLPAWDLESLRPFVQVNEQQTGVLAFLERFKWMTGILVDYEACRRVAYENVEDAYRENISYIELRFSPWFMAEAHGLDPNRVVKAVIEGVAQGIQDFGVRVNIIGILSRTYGPQTAHKELHALLQNKQHIIGLDLAGDEAHWPAHLFVEHFKKARDAGWHITVHAGESAGAESVWIALKELGAERIGHAVHAPEDEALMNYLGEKCIIIECNLTSNVQTSTVKGYASHPIKLFMDRGLLATINTDDPGISAIDLAYEYSIAAPAAGLTSEMILQVQHNALEGAFLTSDEKLTLLKN